MGEQETTQQNTGFNTAGANKSSRAMTFILGTIAVAVIIVLVIMFAPKNGGSGSIDSKYTVLFRNIDLTEAAKVLESLNAQGIRDIKLEDGGKTILIPKKQKDTAAINIAGEGIMPDGGFVGYEIFDQGGQLGATDFDKQIKLSRAISGELSRNIRRIRGIEEARVQVVIPQKQMFATEQNPVQAAVFVKIQEDILLTPSQVKGIIALVSSSVENLQKENVTVVDYKGRVLSSDEYYNDYERLFALLQKQKSELDVNKTAKKGLFVGAEAEVSLEKTGTFKGADIYKNLRSAKKEITDKKLRTVFNDISKKSNTAEDLLAAKLKFKEKYEELLEKNVDKISREFFPKDSFAAKVNIELNNAAVLENDPDSMIARTTTVVLLDENNKNITLTPEIQEALFKALASSVGYVRGRDRIDLRWAPMVSVYSKGLANEKQTDKIMSVFSSVFGKEIKSTEKNKKSGFSFNFIYVLYLAGIFFLYKIIKLIFSKKKVLVPETETASSIFERKAAEEKETADFDDLKKPSIEQIKAAADKAPERVAAVLEKWFQEDEENEER